MRPIRLPEPPSISPGVPEIFEGDMYSVIRRAVIIGNGSPGSENQSIGLVRALGLADKQLLYVSFFRLVSSFFFFFVKEKESRNCAYAQLNLNIRFMQPHFFD